MIYLIVIPKENEQQYKNCHEFYKKAYTMFNIFGTVTFIYRVTVDLGIGGQ